MNLMKFLINLTVYFVIISQDLNKLVILKYVVNTWQNIHLLYSLLLLSQSRLDLKFLKFLIYKNSVNANSSKKRLCFKQVEFKLLPSVPDLKIIIQISTYDDLNHV